MTVSQVSLLSVLALALQLAVVITVWGGLPPGTKLLRDCPPDLGQTTTPILFLHIRSSSPLLGKLERVLY